MKALRIAVVVHGRFNAFDLTKALIERGHEVTLFTNYPKWAVRRFGIPSSHVKSLWLHGIVSRVIQYFNNLFNLLLLEAFLCRWFGRWSAQQLRQEAWDFILSWSGISEEILINEREIRSVFVAVVRESSHIDAQNKILRHECERIGAPLVRPSDWILAREKREYEKSKFVLVSSSFAKRSFLEQGIPAEKIIAIPWAAPLENFKPAAEVIDRRCERICAGLPLRILYVGSISYRKGLWDLCSIIKALEPGRQIFRLVGAVASETKALVAEIKPLIWLDKKYFQNELPEVYAWADLFIFPTLEDGYPAVLAQAYASALPILTTTNCSGPDFIEEDMTGWILPIRSPASFVKRLRWCDGHRKNLAEMVLRIHQNADIRRWGRVVSDFEVFFQNKFKD